MNDNMDEDRSDAADQLLTYLANGKTSREALTLFLVEDENLPYKFVDTVAMAENLPDPATVSASESWAGDYWRMELEETKKDLVALKHTVELEAVANLLDEDPIAILDEAFHRDE
jgi:hypothetical protein